MLDVNLSIGFYFLDVEYERQCKRRRLYREPSISPVQLAEGEGGEEKADTHPGLTTHINSDDLIRGPDYKSKCRFLHSLALEAVPVEKRHRKCYLTSA